MKSNDTNNQKTKAEELYMQGWHFHCRRKYESAVKCYKEAAELGYTTALYYLALLYYEGKGVDKYLEKTAKCFEAVAKAGGKRSEEAKLRLERLADINSGKGIGIVGTDLDNWIVVGAGFGPQDTEEYRKMWALADQGELKAQKYVADTIWLHIGENGCPDGDGETMLRYLRNLADHGDAWAQCRIAEIFINDTIVGVGIGDVDDQEGIKWYREAAQNGDAEAQYLLSDFLYRGDHVKQDKEESFYWWMHYIEATDYLDKSDLDMIGYPYTYEDGKQWTAKEAFRLFKKYAEQGDPYAQYCLGYFYFDGECVRKNLDTAVKWFTKAAEQGHEEAQFKLGALYYEGDKVEQNKEKAFKWYRKSAEQGRALSQYMLGEFYTKGEGVAQNDQEAVKWYRKSARQTDKEPWRMIPKDAWRACKRLGLRYHGGKGVKQSDVIAARWYEKAGRILLTLPDSGAELCDIAESYFFGEGISQNYQQAIKWYKKAAQFGNLYAIRQLAELYEQGVVVKQDYKEAYKWYAQLACRGEIDAHYKTGLFYLEGKGVKPNKKKALARIRKAASFGSKEAKEKLLELGEK